MTKINPIKTFTGNKRESQQSQQKSAFRSTPQISRIITSTRENIDNGPPKDNENQPQKPMRFRHQLKSRVKDRSYQREPRKIEKLHLPDDTLKIIPIGGLGEVGRNMTLIQWKDDILIIDIGMGFPEEDMPGIDLTIPNIEYLQQNKENIRAALFCHGHLDHIGAIPYIIDKIGNPPIYTAPLTKGIILKRHSEFKYLPKLNITEVKPGSKIKEGIFEIEFFHQNHTIPDDLGIVIRTPVGTLVYTSDFKFDETPIYDKPADKATIKKYGDEGIQILLSDSTGAESEGKSISESVIQQNLEQLIGLASGRVIAATFSSLLNRVQQMIHIAEKLDRKVIIEGYSMRTNVAVAQELGYMKIKKGTIIQAKNMDDYPDNRLIVICTGAQGEGNAALMRIVSGEHRFISLRKGDSVIFSSSVVPGNERTVQALKDNIYRQGAKVFHYKMMDLHAGGHGQTEDLALMLHLIRPKFFMPVHGNYSMLVNHAELAQKIGVVKPENCIIVDNGNIVHLTKEKAWIDKKHKVPADLVMVDGLGVGDVGEIVLRDRQMMAQDGMFVIIATVDMRTGKVKGNPDIISRGFVYLRESQELLMGARKKVKEFIESTAQKGGPINSVYVKNVIRDSLGQYLFSKTERRPMVLPVIIEV